MSSSNFNLPTSQTPVWGADRIALFVAPMLMIVFVVVFSGWTGPSPDARSAFGETASILITSAPWAIAWLTAAAGFGWPIRLWLFSEARDSLLVQIAAGIAALLWIDAALGAAGLLQIGKAIGAWAVILVGLALTMTQCARWLRTKPVITPVPWHEWLALPSVTVLLVAACAAPGWLWASEFGGYDALSYHLQLPKEWMALGSAQPLKHNVYSFLPGYVEAAYYHLAILVGDATQASYACQLLHAGFTLFAAACLARLCSRIAGPWAGSIAAAVFLTAPWVIVVGSLAYNEMAVLAMLAAIMLVVFDTHLQSWRCGAVVGLLCGAAYGAKLTSIGFVVAPGVVLLLWTRSRREWFACLAAAAATGLVTLAPYLVRNAIATGNPVFPFAPELFGYGHWTPEQAEIWSRAHSANGSAGQRVTELWNQFLRYGVGANPYPGEPWKLQWSVLPIVGVVAAIIAVVSKSSRRWAVPLVVAVFLQILFWLTMTHLKSRFLLPAVIALSALAGIAGGHIVHRRAGWARGVCAFVLMALNVPVLWVFMTERDGAPAAAIGSALVLSGERLSAAERQELGTTTLPAIAINYLLPENARVLLIGDARPFYYRTDRIAYQTTWDRGPMSQVMHEFPDDQASWLRELRTRGFTHMLVDASMLRRWERSAWNDSRLTDERIREFVSRHARRVYSYPGEMAIYELIAQ